MLTALLLRVGLPFLTLGIGWIAKKWHIQPVIDDLTDDLARHKAALASMQGRDAKTPTDKPNKPGAA